MISFYDAQITDILPVNISESDDVKALSYSVKIAMQKLQNYATNSRIYAYLAGLPGEILDALAIELRSQYYSEDLPIEVKRNIIKNTMLWYSIAGTTYAVEELIKTIFGSGKITEWFNYDQREKIPGTFVVETSTPMNPDVVTTFTEVIKNVKNTRSHLDQIYFITDISAEINIGTANVYSPTVVIKDSGL